MAAAVRLPVLTVVDDRPRDAFPEDALDLVALAERTNDDGHAYPISVANLEAWLVDGALGERGDDGRLRLTREAWSLAARAFG